jgi:lipoprotein-anchoring transpeptidase ErfK/SrfK
VSPFPRRTASRALIGFAATAALISLVLSGCTPKGTTPQSGPTLSSSTAPSASSSASSSAAPVHLVAASPQSPMKALAFAVTGGKLATVTVTNHAGGLMVPGKVAGTGTNWGSDDLAYPGATYDVSAAVTDSLGEVQTLKTSIRVTTLSSTSTVGYNVTPAAGWTVGVNAPIVIRFYKPIKDKAAVERALTVLSSTPTVGAWHWLGSQELHFRPQTTWPAHAQVRLVAALHGVRAGTTLFGLNSSTIDFTVGDAHLTKVDGKKHTLSVYIAGKLFATWPTSLGRPEFATRSGNYIVLLKQPTRRMTSCHANITCDPKNANFYDLTVNWDARLTWSGTFIHSAPWSVSHQGRSNVSHGCINLSPSHAISYYHLAQYGDLVTVTGTSRNATDLVASGDPGMTDWNTTWTAWVAGSALHASLTTSPLM